MREKVLLLHGELHRLAVATSSRTFSTAGAVDDAARVAPATDCRASTSGTPAANMVEVVRANRAIAALCRITPITGILNSARSVRVPQLLRTFPGRAETCDEAAIPINIAHHHFCTNTEMRDDQLGEGRQVGAEAR